MALHLGRLRIMGRRKCRSCCSPCGFNCSPCLGSVAWDYGTCGAVTFMLPVPDPCDSFADVEPQCSISDCMVEDCELPGDEFICSSSYTLLDATINADLYARIQQIRGHRFSIQVLGDKQFRLTINSEIAQKMIVVADIDVIIDGVTYSCSRPAANCGTYTSFNNFGCPGTSPFAPAPRVFCGPGFDFFSGISVKATYQADITIADCADFLGTHNIPRINSAADATITVNAGSPINACVVPYRGGYTGAACSSCTPFTLNLDDCFPSTLDVTIA